MGGDKNDMRETASARSGGMPNGTAGRRAQRRSERCAAREALVHYAELSRGKRTVCDLHKVGNKSELRFGTSRVPDRNTYGSHYSSFSDVVALHALLYECRRAACTRRVSLPEDGLYLVYSMGKRAPLGAHSYGVPIAH